MRNGHLPPRTDETIGRPLRPKIGNNAEQNAAAQNQKRRNTPSLVRILRISTEATEKRYPPSFPHWAHLSDGFTIIADL